MSKKYDEYVNNINKLYPNSDKYVPMMPEIDKELDREIRDRAIISLIKASIECGMDLTYGDVVKIIDNDSSEKEYENNKNNLEKTNNK